MSQEIITFKNIFFRYDKKRDIIKGVSFSINKGEYVCIIGHNGSGKSTLSKILMGLLKPYEGTMIVDGKIITEDNKDFLREKIGVVFQNPDSQFIGITAEDDIAFGLENRKIDRELMKQIVLESSRTMNIEDILKFDSQKLSGGQKQRVAIAGILAINPDVIIFDESTSMLDPKGKIQLKEMMIDLMKNHNKTIISITHDMEEVLNATKVIVMNQGKVERIGDPKEIFSDKKWLNSIKLDIPFSLKLSLLLNSSNKKIKFTTDEKKLLENICNQVK